MKLGPSLSGAILLALLSIGIAANSQTTPYQDTFRIASGQALFDGSALVKDINNIFKTVDANDLILIEAAMSSRNNLTIRNINCIYSPELAEWPLIIKNDPNATNNVEFNDLSWSFQLKFQNVKHTKVVSESVNGQGYGIRLSGDGNTNQYDVGLAISEDCDFLTISGVEICHTSVSGLKSDWGINSSDTASYNDSYNGERALMENIGIHYCYIHHTGNEGIYLGHTTYYFPNGNGQYNFNMKNVNVSHNLLENTAWDAIQISSEIGRSQIHDNHVSYYGTPGAGVLPNFDHGNGIQLGDGGCADIFNNVVKRGYSHGIVDYGRHNTSIYNNVIIEPGYSYTGNWNVNGITIYDENLETSSFNYLKIYNNTIVGTRSHSVYYSADNAQAQNLFCNNLIMQPTLSTISVQDNPDNILDSVSYTNLIFTYYSEIGFADSLNFSYIINSGSPTIDAGTNLNGTTLYTNVLLSFDVHGNPRPAGSTTDIGAYEALPPLATQNIAIDQGWSLISSYISPQYPDASSIFGNVLSGVDEILKDENGNVCWPFFGVNAVGNIEAGKAYLLRSSMNKNINISGLANQPEALTLVLYPGWNYIAYPRANAADIAQISSGMNLVAQQEMIKDHHGNVYWPFYNINEIGTMLPGRGYQVLVSSIRSFTYPANSIMFPSVLSAKRTSSGTMGSIQSGENMILLIPVSVLKNQANIGDKIIVSDSYGKIIAKAIIKDEDLLIPIWGDDPYTNEKDGMSLNEQFFLQLYQADKMQAKNIILKSYALGDNLYARDKISIVSSFNQAQNKSGDMILDFALKLYPNPSTEYAMLDFELENSEYLSISLYDANMRRMDNLLDSNFGEGKHQVLIDTSVYSKGVYYLNLMNNKESGFLKLMIL
jgi:hypothetical protein